MKRNHDIIALQISIHFETEKAVQVENLKGKKVWLPKSQVEPCEGGVELPEWLAEEKELI